MNYLFQQKNPNNFSILIRFNKKESMPSGSRNFFVLFNLSVMKQHRKRQFKIHLNCSTEVKNLINKSLLRRNKNFQLNRQLNLSHFSTTPRRNRNGLKFAEKRLPAEWFQHNIFLFLYFCISYSEFMIYFLLQQTINNDYYRISIFLQDESSTDFLRDIYFN